ncbi:hypothetical protein [Niabella sp.]|uniref:helix-turn-helix domain-containing protein n=1 Tax=Niabella sp. TaxID=1962976 RepID=UPI0026335DE6|nr:hypothetical protein [Niabella sp.]
MPSMKAHEKKEKKEITFQFAVALKKAMEDADFNPTKLALEIGMEKSHMQLIANGKKNLTLSSQIAIADGLGISYTQLAVYFDEVTKTDEKKFLEYQKKQQELKARKKKI